MTKGPAVTAAMAAALAASPAGAHDPLFGLGPHVLYQGGVEAALGWRGSEGGAGPGSLDLELAYGLTGDWAAGLAVPLAGPSRRPAGDGGLRAEEAVAFTKWRFWRRDGLGVQESAAVALRAPLGGAAGRSGLLGLAYGYESRRWYRWASLRWGRASGAAEAGEGVRLRLDLAGGWRPRRRGYREPDAVWLLELNGERRQPAPPGGRRWVAFLAPGLFWTLRNYAVKAGLQLPLREGPGAGRRALLVLEGHW